MIPYFIAFLISIFLAWLSCTVPGQRLSGARTKKPHIILFALSGLIAALLLGFREGVGTDFYGIYVSGFESATMGLSGRFELGFALLQQVIASWTQDYRVFIFITSALTVFLVYIAIYNHSLNPSFAVLVFLVGGLFFFSANAIRQGIASALLLNAAPYVFKKKPVPYVLLTLAASLFHQVAIVFIPLYFVRRFRIGTWVSLAILVAVVLLGSLIVPSILNFGYSISNQFARYSSIESYLVGNLDLADATYLLLAMALCLYVKYSTKEKKSDNLSIAWNILLIGLIVSLLTASAFILYRIARLFAALLVLMVPNLLQRIPEERRRLAIGQCYAITLIAMAVILYGVVGIDGVVPYEWWLW